MLVFPEHSIFHPSGLKNLDPAVPERVVASEEEREQKEMLKTSWELISVLDFLSTFHPYMASMANLQFSAEELESALVLSNGTGGLLADLHIVSSHALAFLLLLSPMFLSIQNLI